MDISKDTAFSALVDDIARAVLTGKEGPRDIVDHREIIARLGASEEAFPPIYRDAVNAPLLGMFSRMGRDGWHDILSRDQDLQGIGLLGLDLVQTQAQRAEEFHDTATRALQEVVSDLYDGFLSDADRGRVKRPDHGVAPPLVKWGRPGLGPYAWTAPSAALYGCGAGVVNMPPAFASRGLAAWAALGHETAGHHVLHADDGLREDLSELVYSRITGSESGHLEDEDEREGLAAYWRDRIDESASDVMGVMNMGPAAALGLIAYFRGLSLASGGDGRLSAIGSATGVHPAPLARGWLMAEALERCSFSKAKPWADAISAEVDRDAPKQGVWLAGRVYSSKAVKHSASLVASAIMTGRTRALQDARLIDIQDWREHDQQLVEALALHVMLGGANPPQSAFRGLFAAHAVAAAITAALISGRPQEAQQSMVTLLSAMHASNPSWSELNIANPGAFGGMHFGSGGETFASLRPSYASGKDSDGEGSPPPGRTGGGRGGFDVGVVLARGGPTVPVLASSTSRGGPGVIVLLGSNGNWSHCDDPEALRQGLGVSERVSLVDWTLANFGIKRNGKGGIATISGASSIVTPKAATLLIGSAV